MHVFSGKISQSISGCMSRFFRQQPVSIQLTSYRFMSKYLSKAAKKRIPLTTKVARKGFYKGNRSTKEGRLTSKGRFIVDPLKRLELVIPDLEGFKLKPYVASTASRFPPELDRNRLSK